MIVDWLEENIDDSLRYTGNGREVHFNCPNCTDRRHRMYVNLNTGAVYCHNCGFKGNFVSLIALVTGSSYEQSKRIYSGIESAPRLEGAVTPDRITGLLIGNEVIPQKRAIPLPREYSPIDTDNPGIVEGRALDYLHSRGITDDQMTRYHMGFCADGPYYDRVIIPITENGSLRFWVARAISPGARRKEMSPSNEPHQISKSEVVFNIDRAASRYHAAVISEGIFDALSWGDIGVSLLGKRLYDAQIPVISRYRDSLYNGIYIALDADARLDEMHLADRLSGIFDNVYVVMIPDGLDDPNNVLTTRGHDYLLSLLGTAEPYSRLSAVRLLLS